MKLWIDDVRTPPDRDELEQLIGQDLTQREIAQKLGRTRISVRYWLRKYGIPFSTRPGPRPTRECGLCRGCGAQLPRVKYRPEFCSLKCHADDRVQAKYLRWLSGEPVFKSRGSVKSAVIRRDGRNCSICLNDQWLGDPIPLDVDHINGVSTDHRAHNLRLLCPNCHAKTDNYKGKNKKLAKARADVAKMVNATASNPVNLSVRF